jgi:hypothetical protein
LERAVTRNRRRRFGVLLGLALVVVTMSSCTLSYDSVAVGLGAAGEIEVTYAPCPGDQIKKVSMVSWGENTYTELWAIEPNPGSSATGFVVGETPPGWALLTPLREELLPTDELTVEVEVESSNGVHQGPYESFGLSELRQGEVRSQEAYMSVEEFLLERSADCLATGGRKSTLDKQYPFLAAVSLAAVVVGLILASRIRRHLRNRPPPRPDHG